MIKTKIIGSSKFRRKVYYIEKTDLYHREDGPAVEWENGDKEWYINGILNNYNGPAVIRKDVKVWYVNGVKHRVNGPAVEYTCGTKEWWVNGKRHRENGPAIEIVTDNNSSLANKYHFYLNGRVYSEKEYWEEFYKSKFGNFV